MKKESSQQQQQLLLRNPVRTTPKQQIPDLSEDEQQLGILSQTFASKRVLLEKGSGDEDDGRDRLHHPCEYHCKSHPIIPSETNLHGLVAACLNHGYDRVFHRKCPGRIPCWDVSRVTNMDGAFAFYDDEKKETNSFNKPLCHWDVSSVTSMKGMFGVQWEFNQSLNSWNVSRVTDMSSMFYYAERFNGPVDEWDVSAVQNTNSMFYGAIQFNQPIFYSWNISSVTNMVDMFHNDVDLCQPGMELWDTSGKFHTHHIHTIVDDTVDQEGRFVPILLVLLFLVGLASLALVLWRFFVKKKERRRMFSTTQRGSDNDRGNHPDDNYEGISYMELPVLAKN